MQVKLSEKPQVVLLKAVVAEIEVDSPPPQKKNPNLYTVFKSGQVEKPFEFSSIPTKCLFKSGQVEKPFEFLLYQPNALNSCLNVVTPWSHNLGTKHLNPHFYRSTIFSPNFPVFCISHFVSIFLDYSHELEFIHVLQMTVLDPKTIDSLRCS